MQLYQIDQAISALVDPETGEVADFEFFENLQMERETKIENLLLYYKNQLAEADAIKSEIDKLTMRRDTNIKKAAKLLEYAGHSLNGEAFKSPRVALSYRKSSAVEIIDKDECLAWAVINAPDAIIYKTPEVSKSELKTLINNGAVPDGAQLVERNNIKVV